MLYEPTTLASIARRIGETLSADYDLDPKPMFAKLGIDSGAFFRPGARVPFATMNELWRLSIAATGDPWFGFAVGARAMPADFFVLGHAWLASATLHGAMQRLCRYGHVLTTRTSRLELQDRAEGYALVESFPEGAVLPQKAAKDAGFVALIGLCDIITAAPVRPLRVELTVPVESRSDRYDELFQCPVEYGSNKETLLFAARGFDAPLVGSVPEVARATDRIAENYVASLDGSAVATAVRQMLVQMLPSGRTDQDTVAKRLHRSRSTLQRQLGAEGTSYRDILETTRQKLSEQYLQDGEYSQAQIAFMVGFADQSNFARAFKRWTGVSPGDYQKAA
jgi:AraC-like DNA-binding protein